MAKFILIIAIVLTILGGGYLAWSNGYIHLNNPLTDPQIAEIQKRGTLIVGTDATYAPLEYVNDKKQIVGFDIDLATEIAKDMNVKLDLRNISFDKIFDALKNSDVDLVISAVTITTERQKEMLFSAPYLNAGQVIVVKTSNKEITNITALKGKTVGVQEDTTSKDEAVKYTDSIHVYADYTPAKIDLSVGKIDAIIIDYPAAVSMVQNSREEFRIVDSPFTSEFYGVVAALDKTGLINSVNNTISRLKSSGKLNSMEGIWFKQ